MVHAGPFIELMRDAGMAQAGGEAARVVAEDFARSDLNEHGRQAGKIGE